jgi:hypothetical protein
LVSTQNLLNLISSPNLISTTAGLERYISSFIDPQELASSIRPFISVPNLTNLVSTANLINLVSTQNLVNLVSTTYLDTQVASTVRGLGTAGYLSSVPGVVSTPNLTNLVSTANLINLVSTANLRSLVSTSFLDTTLQSTVGGLGTSEYVSTASLYSTVARWADYQATSGIVLASSNATIINPFPFEPGTEGIYPLRIQTTLATIYDSNNGPGQLELGTLSFANSSLIETFFLGNQYFL